MEKQKIKYIHFFLAILLISSITLAFGCTQKQASTQEQVKNTASEQSSTITIKNFAFNPTSLNIKKGTTVTWTNEDSVTHTIVIEGVFDSGKLSNGQSISYNFNQSGTFAYHCSIHPSMKGEIVVQ